MSDRLLYFEDNYPVFQNRMYTSSRAARDCTKGTIRLVEDSDTGLVRNSAFDASLMVYDREYQNEQANSSKFLAHLYDVQDIVLRTLGNNGLIEIGCGKGFFLEMLQAAGAGISGFDAAYEGTNPAIEPRYFSSKVESRAKGIVLRHVLEHIEEPADFLAQIAEANANQGLIYIEVPCLDWILRNKAWFDIYYEHVNYFRLNDFERMFGTVVEKGHLFGGQYLYVVAELGTIKRPERNPSEAVEFPSDFTASIANLSEPSDGQPSVIWGGGVERRYLCVTCRTRWKAD